MSMNWGVRGALLTSEHFAAPGQLKLRFSAVAGPKRIARVQGGMRRASRAVSDLASKGKLAVSIAFCSL